MDAVDIPFPIIHAGHGPRQLDVLPSETILNILEHLCGDVLSSTTFDGRGDPNLKPHSYSVLCPEGDRMFVFSKSLVSRLMLTSRLEACDIKNARHDRSIRQIPRQRLLHV